MQQHQSHIDVSYIASFTHNAIKSIKESEINIDKFWSSKRSSYIKNGQSGDPVHNPIRLSLEELCIYVFCSYL